MMDRWSPDLFEYVVNYWLPGGAGGEPAPGGEASPPPPPRTPPTIGYG